MPAPALCRHSPSAWRLSDAGSPIAGMMLLQLLQTGKARINNKLITPSSCLEDSLHCLRCPDYDVVRLGHAPTEELTLRAKAIMPP